MTNRSFTIYSQTIFERTTNTPVGVGYDSPGGDRICGKSVAGKNARPNFTSGKFKPIVRTRRNPCDGNAAGALRRARWLRRAIAPPPPPPSVWLRRRRRCVPFGACPCRGRAAAPIYTNSRTPRNPPVLTPRHPSRDYRVARAARKARAHPFETSRGREKRTTATGWWSSGRPPSQ